jgi:uncharacterized protein
MNKAMAIVLAAAVAAALLTVAVASSPTGAAESATPESKPAAAPVKVLILVGGHPYDEKAFPQAWSGHDDIQCEVWKGKPYTAFDDISKWSYDAILLYNFSSDITDAQKANFQALLKKGVGLVVWHHALADCQGWPEFEKIAGCKFWLAAGERPDGTKVPPSGTGWGTFKLHVTDPNHPITKGVKDFDVQDESYNKQTFTKDIHVLLTTEDPKSDKNIAWVVQYDKARIFGFQSGHDVKVWANPGFRQVLANGLRWVAGKLGTAAPAEGKSKGT